MQFLVLNRDSVKHFKTDKVHILIQIYCSNDYVEPIEFLSSRRDVLKLQFDDWNAEQKIKIESRYENSQKMKDMIYFDNNLAKSIVEFVKKHIDDIEMIICQCDAGISRSAAVAAALSKCIHGNDEYYFKHYLPNSLVYKTILEEWYKND